MKIENFELERYFGAHEFTAKYLLSSSDCDGYPMQYILDQATPAELKIWQSLELGYTESAGHPMLRSAIAKHYHIKSMSQIIVSSPGELNFAAMNVILDKEDHVISVAPSYQSLHEVVRSIGCELSFWKPKPDNWQFDVSDLAPLIRKNTKLIIINFPHNPTGSYLTKDQQMELVTLGRKHGLYIFSDEMYHKLMASDMEELPPISDLYEKGISLWGTSKTFGLAGLRTGWLVSQDQKLLNRILSYKDYLSICSSAPSEILAMIAIQHIDKFLNPNLKKIKSNIKLFTEFSNSSALIEQFSAPRAGSAAFVKLNINLSAKAFSDQLIKKTGIMTVPAEMFGYKGPYIRVGFGRENFSQTLNELSTHLSEYPQSYLNP